MTRFRIGPAPTMATVISITERRDAKARPEEKLPSLGPGTMVAIFTGIALAMTAAAVLVGANSWDDAITLVILISVVALLKLVLADVMFIAMLRADEQPDPRLAVVPADPEPPPQQRRPAGLLRHPKPARPHATHHDVPRFELVEGRTLAARTLAVPPGRKPQR